MTEVSRLHPLETGGVLLGICNAEHIWIEEMIGPGPAAVHRHAAFVPDVAYQETAIAEAYRQSRRRLVYLGDWHSHPGGGSTPSGRDKATLRRIAAYDAARQKHPIMLIVGQESNLAVWRYADGLWFWPRIQRMQLVTTE